MIDQSKLIHYLQILIGWHGGNQVQGVGKKKLYVLRLVVDQGQLQVMQVRPDEDEIDRLIDIHDDHLSRKGCVG